MFDKLKPGDFFPGLSLQLANGAEFILPTDIETPLAVVLFYRGHW